MSGTIRDCDHCGTTYEADSRNLKRGWGLTCSKSCAAKKREMSKKGYNPKRVEKNNFRRLMWNEGETVDRGHDYNGHHDSSYDPHPFSSDALGQWSD